MNRNNQRVLATEITSVLTRLRRAIRAYVWIDGLALAGIWLGLTFWVGLSYRQNSWLNDWPREDTRSWYSHGATASALIWRQWMAIQYAGVMSYRSVDCV